MKARARILMLLAFMVSFTGFGFTTPDLVQDSDAVMVADYDVGSEISAINVVVLKYDFVVFENHFFNEFERVFDTGSAKEIFSKKTIVLETLINEQRKPPLLHLKQCFTDKGFKDARTKYKNYRLARDGIRAEDPYILKNLIT